MNLFTIKLRGIISFSFAQLKDGIENLPTFLYNLIDN